MAAPEIVRAISYLRRAADARKPDLRRLRENAAVVAKRIESAVGEARELPRGYGLVEFPWNRWSVLLLRGPRGGYIDGPPGGYISGLDGFGSLYSVYVERPSYRELHQFAKDIASGLLREITALLEEEARENERAAAILEAPLSGARVAEKGQGGASGNEDVGAAGAEQDVLRLEEASLRLEESEDRLRKAAAAMASYLERRAPRDVQIYWGYTYRGGRTFHRRYEIARGRFYRVDEDTETGEEKAYQFGREAETPRNVLLRLARDVEAGLLEGIAREVELKAHKNEEAARVLEVRSRVTEVRSRAAEEGAERRLEGCDQ